MSGAADSEAILRALLADGAVELRAARSCWPHVASWLPLRCAEPEGSGTARATITVDALLSAADPPHPTGRATLRVGTVRAWIDAGEARAVQYGRTLSRGTVDLRVPSAEVQVDLDATEGTGADVSSMLTVASALVLGRMGDVLIHAGAVVAHDGTAWLVVGDARSGKSTTCVSLARCGLDLLSDDQVVLRPAGDAVQVEGWLRPLHLDAGWEQGVPVGERRTVHPSALGPWEGARVAPIAGTVHTTIEPDAPSAATDLSAADAFTRLVRQSPWLLADRGVTPDIVGTLTRVARLPRFLLRLGRDTFGRPDRLRALLPSIPY